MHLGSAAQHLWILCFFPSLELSTIKEITMKLFILGLTAAMGFSSIASTDCGDAASRVIEQKGFTVRDKGLEALFEPQNGNLTGYRAWFRVAQCDKGYVIVNMRETGLVKHIWAQGSCDVPGVQQALRNRD